MTLESFVFYSMAALTLASALGVVTLKNTVHAALLLGLSLAGVAGLFAMLGADFLFGGQILIYVSGIAVLMVFVVMLLGRSSDLHLRQVNSQWLAGLLICGISLAGLWRVVALFTKTTQAAPVKPTTRDVGKLLLGDFALPFEVISLVLLSALLGAIYFSHIGASEEEQQ